jgi:hypothetical protein
VREKGGSDRPFSCPHENLWQNGLTQSLLLIILNSTQAVEVSMIEHFRAHWFDQIAQGSTLADRSAAELAVSPGRAEGRIAHWSLCRAVAALRHGARRPLHIGAIGAPTATPSERAFLSVLDAMANGDQALAQRHAEWLVHKSALPGLLGAITPLADIYPKLARAA